MEKLLLQDPQAQVLVSSGYSADPIMSEYKNYGFCGCIPKPYTIEQMSMAIYRALEVNESRQG
jgi:two-component system, cell cycle sensor histidine kinase and response regulator CckA